MWCYARPGFVAKEDGLGTRALDATTGKLLWRDRHVVQANSDTLVYFTRCPDSGCEVYARDVRTGREAWKAPTAVGLSGVDLAGDTLMTTSYPYGTKRQPDPYTPKTQVQTFAAQSGKPFKLDRLGNSFALSPTWVIEESFLASRGTSCSLTLVAWTHNGAEMWRRTIDWKLSQESQKKDFDCALDVEVHALDGERVEVSAGGRTNLVLSPVDGATVWNLGPTRRMIYSTGGVDVISNKKFSTFWGHDSKSKDELWRQDGDFPTDVGDLLMWELPDDPDTDPQMTSGGFKLTSRANGDEILKADGSYLNHGSTWIATSVWGEQDGTRAFRVLLLKREAAPN